MPGPHYDRFTEATKQSLIDKHILPLASQNWPIHYRRQAVELAEGWQRLFTEPAAVGPSPAQPVAVTDTDFTTVATSIAGYINVAMPALPAGDLSAQPIADLITLAKALDLANWDYKARLLAFESTIGFYRRNGQQPTLLAFRDRFLAIANYTRQPRYAEGLSNLTA